MKIKIHQRTLTTIILPLALCMFHQKADAQVAVNGPRCVTAGATYQYLINGAGDSSSATQVCITGGVIEGSQSNCKRGGFPSILVRWNEGTATGTIIISTAKGNATRNVSITKALNAGSVDTSNRTRRIDFNTAYNGIQCSPATGGSCSPVYVYQWQFSSDCLNWTNMQEAKEQNLGRLTSLRQTTYYRRKVLETVSHSEKYSDVAIVFVNPDMEGHR